jgi:uncharacterized Rmd1/YagE family protein
MHMTSYLQPQYLLQQGYQILDLQNQIKYAVGDDASVFILDDIIVLHAKGYAHRMTIPQAVAMCNSLSCCVVEAMRKNT